MVIYVKGRRECSRALFSERQFLNFPVALVKDKSLKPGDLRLYVLISLHPGSTISGLSRLIGCGRDVVRSQCRRLESSGWVEIRAHRSRKSVFATVPHDRQRILANLYKEEISFASRVGQTHMREWLKMLVDTQWFFFDARPYFLQSPETSEFLEYDCFLPAFNKAWEFHGPQHFRTTTQFPNEGALRKLQIRDHLKASLSQDHGVELVVITTNDLNYKSMMAKMPSGVPLRFIDEKGPLVRSLEVLCRAYAANIERMLTRQDRKIKSF